MDEDEFHCGTRQFLESARNGLDGRLYWPGLGEVTADELVLRTLLPMADEGCAAGGWPPGPRSLSRGDRGPREDRPQRVGLAGGHGARTAGAGRGPAAGTGRDAAALLRADAQQRTGAHLGATHLIRNAE